MTDYEQDPDVCPSSLNEDGVPAQEGQTDHIWYLTTNFAGENIQECSECGAVHELLLSETQEETKRKGCPQCGSKDMHAALDEGSDDGEKMELYLHCDHCLMAMDSDGGYTY
jgi:DNA-directed RNA polymerase subunit RPC12/RpoP